MQRHEVNGIPVGGHVPDHIKNTKTESVPKSTEPTMKGRCSPAARVSYGIRQNASPVPTAAQSAPKVDPSANKLQSIDTKKTTEQHHFPLPNSFTTSNSENLGTGRPTSRNNSSVSDDGTKSTIKIEKDSASFSAGTSSAEKQVISPGNVKFCSLNDDKEQRIKRQMEKQEEFKRRLRNKVQLNGTVSPPATVNNSPASEISTWGAVDEVVGEG